MTEVDPQGQEAGASVLAEKVETSEASATLDTLVSKDASAEKDSTATTETTGASEESADAGDAGEEPKRKTGSARKSEEIASLRAEVERLRGQVANAPVDKPPALADFDDYDKYEMAKLEYAAKRAVSDSRRADASMRLKDVEQQHIAALARDHQSRVAEARVKIADYDKVFKEYYGPSPSPSLDLAIVESDKSELLTYHLAKRPELVRALNAMTPVHAARELGRLEAKLSYPAQRTETKAPPPVAALKGGSPVTPAIGKSMRSYEKWRSSQDT